MNDLEELAAIRRENVTADALAEVLLERQRQHGLWGEQNPPDVGDPYTRAWYSSEAVGWKITNADRVGRDVLAWDGILLEEVFEALAESDPTKLRAELVQVAAVCVAWCEAIDRRSK